MLWPYREARRVIGQLGGRKDVVLETGFGPSGPPHIGTYGEIVRTNFVALAMKDLGYRPRIISFLDDLDGLRKVPEGFPAWVSDYLGRPVCEIPDPFECCESFSKHMHKLLLEMVNDAGAKCEYHLSSEEYARGTFNNAIETVMNNVEALKRLVVPMLSDEIGARWFPFFAKCESCGKLYTTRVVSFNVDSETVDYVCDCEFGTVRGCGHHGTTSYLNGAGKLPWRIDWPARWFALNVDYEIHGKDLIESASLGKRIMNRVFGRPPILTMVYELFLDADGKKISKSKGFAIDPTLWLKYGTRDSLHLMLYKKPKQAKRLDISRMPSYVNEAFEMSADYYRRRDEFGQPDKRHPYEILTLLSPPDSDPGRMDFATLCNLVAALGERSPDVVKRYALKLAEQSRVEDSGYDVQSVGSGLVDELVQKAIKFADDILATQRAYEVELSGIELQAVRSFVDYLRSGEFTGEEIQTTVFNLAREPAIPQPRMFQILYALILNQRQGPRLGQFIPILGQSRTADRIEASLAKLGIRD
ncbi:MAG TPA: lysine--tRNA ligase [bacterium]|nr:lysine--tRNA ligase [bacterium]